MKINKLKKILTIFIPLGTVLVAALFFIKTPILEGLASYIPITNIKGNTDTKNQRLAKESTDPKTDTPSPSSTQQKALQGSSVTGQHSSDKHIHIDDERLAEIMKRHITPEMRRQINQALMPNGKPPKVVSDPSSEASYMDLSDRVSTVMVAMIEEGEVIITDITHPLPDDDVQPIQ